MWKARKSLPIVLGAGGQTNTGLEKEIYHKPFTFSYPTLLWIMIGTMITCCAQGFQGMITY